LAQKFPRAPQSPAALNQAGRSYLLKKEPVYAREKFLKVVQAYPRDAEAMFAMYEIGLIDLNQKSYSQAGIFFQKV